MLRLTNRCYINPDRITCIEIRPAGQPFEDAHVFIQFTSEQIDPIQMSGGEAEEAIANLNKYYETRTENGVPLRAN